MANNKNITRTWQFHQKLYPEISKRLLVTHSYLSQINSKEQILKDALKMIELYSSKSKIRKLQLEFFCINHYNLLFHSKVDKFMGVLRAIYFPISLSEYFRYLLPNPKE